MAPPTGDRLTDAALRPTLRAVSEALARAGIGRGAEVVVAYSGGADSVALLALLLRLPLELRVEAIHVDHRLRASSAEEAALAVARARALGARARIVAVAVSGAGGIEAAARRARYRALAKAAAGRPILTAHSLDDQAETVLLRLLRGAGMRGAGGIRPVARIAGGRVVRPLLDVRRSELRAVVEALGLEPVEDPSNRDPRFARNRLRREVMPLLERIAPGGAPALARFAELARADDRLLEARARRILGEAGDAFPLERLRRLPLSLRRRVVRSLIRRAAGRWPAAVRVDEVLRLVEKGEGELHLPAGVRVEARDGTLTARRGPTGAAARERPAAPPVDLAPGGSCRLLGWEVRLEGPLPAPGVGGPKDELWLADPLPGPLRVRPVAPAERLATPTGRARKASDLLSAARIPRRLRREALVVEAGGAPVWLVGARPLVPLPPAGAPAWRIRARRVGPEEPG